MVQQMQVEALPLVESAVFSIGTLAYAHSNLCEHMLAAEILQDDAVTRSDTPICACSDVLDVARALRSAQESTTLVLPSHLKQLWLQISVKPSGSSNMLFNTEKLRGMPKKIKALARREAEVSLVQQVYSTLVLSLRLLPKLTFLHFDSGSCPKHAGSELICTVYTLA